jgi:hypothetical protein
MRSAVVLVLIAGLGCARPQHPNPYVPPETQYSTGSTLLAAGGLMTAAVGAQFAQDPRASKSTQTAGTAAMGAGVAAMAASLIDAVEVQKERDKFWKLTYAFYHRYFSPPPFGEPDARPALPPIPEVPFNFEDPPPADEP